jgi:hypothetical protein
MPREVLFEFHKVGNSVKVTAFDPDSLVEVSIVGSPRAPEQALRATALRKLQYVIQKRAQAPKS